MLSFEVRQARGSKRFIYFAEKTLSREWFFEEDAILKNFVTLPIVFQVAGHKDYPHFREKSTKSRS